MVLVPGAGSSATLAAAELEKAPTRAIMRSFTNLAIWSRDEAVHDHRAKPSSSWPIHRFCLTIDNSQKPKGQRWSKPSCQSIVKGGCIVASVNTGSRANWNARAPQAHHVYPKNRSVRWSNTPPARPRAKGIVEVSSRLVVRVASWHMQLSIPNASQRATRFAFSVLRVGHDVCPKTCEASEAKSGSIG